MKKKDFDRYMDRKEKKTPREIILFLLGSSYHKDCKTCNQRVDQALVEIDAIHTSEKRKIASSYFNDGLEAGKKMAEKEFKSKVSKKKDVLKKKLFDILVYIVEPSITDDDVDKIIEKQIMPLIDDFHKDRV